MINDGRIRLRVERVEREVVYTVVEVGGELSSRKGVNLPRADVQVEALTPKDKEYVSWGVKQGVDFIALSFVRKAEDILALKNLLKTLGGDIPVIAKIEKPQAIDHIDEIIVASEGIMVARGDLGVEMSPERVPLIQKSIVQKANMAQKPVIVATQMLESMIEEPVPTRAEVADVANAILDGTDAIMLSGETAVGKFPFETVTMMSRIAGEVEASKLYDSTYTYLSQDHNPDLNIQITRLLDTLAIKAVIAMTQSGHTAEKLSKAKVHHPVIALCPNETMVRRLSILWGIYPLLYKGPFEISEVSLRLVAEQVKMHSFLQPGDPVMMVMGLPYFELGKTTSFRLFSI
jgi:pyruvate kinase